MTNEKQIILDLVAACVSDGSGYVSGPFQDKTTVNTTVGKGPYSDTAFFSLNELMMIKGALNCIVGNIQVLIDAHNKKFTFEVDANKFLEELRKKTFVP